MRLWFFEIGEPLPLEPGKRLLRYGRLTAWLAARGHDVTWWSCDFSHAAKTHVAVSGDHAIAERLKLVVIHGPGYAKNLSLERVRHHRAFAGALRERLAQEKRETLPDLIICPIPTIENAASVAAFAKRAGVPYLLDIRDEWPDELIRALPTLLRGLGRLALAGQTSAARRAARGAVGILGVTRRQLDYGLALAGRSLDPKRDFVLYHGYTRPQISQASRAEALSWWAAQGLNPRARIVSFVGTLGISFTFSAVFAAARALHAAGRADVQFVIAGDGGARARLIDEAGTLTGKTILFPGWIDQPRIDALLCASTAALAPYLPATAMSLPNKFFEYMAYGLPILSSCSGESEALIREERLGMQYDARDLGSFQRALAAIIDDPSERNAMSERSRALFETRFEHARLFAELEQRIGRWERR